ncbi:MAG: hypothetical protein ABUS56_09215 [Acidobacteriota bacterium]
MPRTRRSRIWLASGVVLLAAVVLVVAAAVAVGPLGSNHLRRRLAAALGAHLEGEVEIASLRARMWPRFEVAADGLVVRHRGRRDVPPLIVVRSVAVEASLLDVLRRHVRLVTLSGLEIHVPPDHYRDGAADGDRGTTDAANTHTATSTRGRAIVVDTLVTNDAQLSIIPREPAKPPRVWAIHRLRMQSVAFDRAMPFEAALANAVPPGEIGVQGSFGPWQAGKPGQTPLEGTFTLARADLGVFKGISGILSAHGEFGGVLGRIGIHGETDTPRFVVAVGGHPVPLHADYHATVDGTNGDTILDQIDGSFLGTRLVAKGRVVETAGRMGRTVALDVTMDHARLEDVLRLAAKAARPPMTGALELKTRFVLPPGDRDVVEKLRLDGEFAVARVTFTNIDVQHKVNELSHRSRGRAPAVKPDSVVSNFRGRFRLREATLGLDGLTFDMPGARVRLSGTYGLKPGRLDFKGLLSMDAKLSETQRGFKRLLLKAIDPFFKGKGGGSAIPIKIEGSRRAPSFGLDKGRVFKRGT